MSRPWRRRSSARSGESGFTFVELVVALVILSAAAVALAGSVARALRAVERISGRLELCSRLIELDDVLRSLCARVRTPYWASSHDLHVTEGGIRIGWLDGTAGRMLSLSFSEGVLAVGEEDSIHRYHGFTGARVEVDQTGLEPGVLRLELDLPDARTVAIVARIGGIPIVEPR